MLESVWQHEFRTPPLPRPARGPAFHHPFPMPTCATRVRSQLSNRRDPSGAPPPYQLPTAVPHYLLDDHDIVYTTSQSPPRTATLPQLPPSAQISPCGSPGAASPSASPSSQRFEFSRRGQRCGDVGWGCFTTNPKETMQNGRIDGHALVSSDLHKKHQFMRLSGDPSFEKRAGRMFQSSPRKPSAFEQPGRKPTGLAAFSRLSPRGTAVRKT